MEGEFSSTLSWVGCITMSTPRNTFLILKSKRRLQPPMPHTILFTQMNLAAIGEFKPFPLLLPALRAERRSQNSAQHSWTQQCTSIMIYFLRWRGIRDEKLSEVSGIPGGIFVHASGFIGGGCVASSTTCCCLTLGSAGNKTKQGALEFAFKSLET